ncbi:hypothetical protein ABZ622_12555 [Streptomyces sp. NPDC007164]|uniref:hypothetical protein n=1 Tax=Streptomyces sp. NPDC007164 TaxID=3156918 RepID=UPI0033DEB642
MRDDARGHWVDEVAGLAGRWLGPGVLPEGPRPDEWWAALAARTALAALASQGESDDVARALAAAVGLGLDTGTESLPVLRHPTAVRSAEPVRSRKVVEDAGHAWPAWSPPPGDRDPASRWPRPPVTPARYLEGPEGPAEELSAAELGRRLLTDHLRTGAEEQLDEAEAVLRSVVRGVPSDGAHPESAYGDLAWALLLRFVRSEQREDLDAAIEYAMVARVFDQPSDPGAAHPPPWETVLGMALLARHDLTGRGVDLDNAVASLERSAAGLRGDDPDLDTVLSALADALLCRHGQRGNAADLRRAGELRYNVEQYPSLATARFAAYLGSGDPEALDDAVAAGTASVEQARDPAQRAWSLNNLAGYLLARHEASRDPSDAAAAVDRLNSARELLRRGTTSYAAVSLNLARALMAGPTPLRVRAARLTGEALDTEHTTLALQAQALELLCAVAEFDGGRSPVVEVRAEDLDLRLGALVERLNAESAGSRVSSLRWARARLRRGMGSTRRVTSWLGRSSATGCGMCWLSPIPRRPTAVPGEPSTKRRRWRPGCRPTSSRARPSPRSSPHAISLCTPRPARTRSRTVSPPSAATTCEGGGCSRGSARSCPPGPRPFAGNSASHRPDRIVNGSLRRYGRLCHRAAGSGRPRRRASWRGPRSPGSPSRSAPSTPTPLCTWSWGAAPRRAGRWSCTRQEM